MRRRPNNSLCFVTCVASCGARDGHCGQMFYHRGDTWRVCCRCASCGGGSAHLTWQTASRTPPTSRCTASRRCACACAPSGASSSCTPETRKKMSTLYCKKNSYYFWIRYKKKLYECIKLDRDNYWKRSILITYNLILLLIKDIAYLYCTFMYNISKLTTSLLVLVYWHISLFVYSPHPY